MKNINEQSKQKQIHRYREQIDAWQRGGGLEEWVTKVSGLRSADWQLTKQSWECKVQHKKYSQYIVITIHGARWVLEMSGGTLCKVYNCLTTLLYN